MRHRHAAPVPRRLWEAVGKAPHRLLLLDYDGTLAPFRRQRMEALPLPGVVGRIALIAASGHTTVGVVSGRPLRELHELLDQPDIVLVGEHGWEIWMPRGGGLTEHRLSRAADEALQAIARIALALWWGGRLEIKRTALTLHTRGLPTDEAKDLVSQAETLFEDLGPPAELRLTLVDGGVEIRARELNKGSAVRDLLALSPAGTRVVYIGDDTTDEDAFRAIKDRGFGLRVGPVRHPSIADARLRGPSAVAAFLAEWLIRLEEPLESLHRRSV